MAKDLTPVELAERDAQLAAKREADSRLSKGTRKNLPIDTLTPFPYNARTPDEVRPNAVRVWGSISSIGFSAAYPLVVSQRKSGELVVLQGNCRLAAVQYGFQNHPETANKVLPKRELPCIVLTGLSPADEVSINADHGSQFDRQPLSPWGMFLQVAALVTVSGIKSRHAVAEACDMWEDSKTADGTPIRKLRESYAQRLVYLAELPQYVQDAYRQSSMFKGPNKLPKSGDIPTLYTALKAEASDPSMLGAPPSAKGTSVGFRAVWEKIINAATDEAKSSPRPTTTAVESAATACGSGIIRDAMLLAVGKKEGMDLSALPALVVKAAEYENDHATLTMIRKYLGPARFAELVEEARKMPVELVEALPIPAEAATDAPLDEETIEA